MKAPLRLAVRLLPAVAAGGLLAAVLGAADLRRALGIVDAVGWRLPLLLLPNGLVMVLETVGWWRAFGRFWRRPRFLGLLAVRVTGEALMLGLPSGSLVNESMQPYLLRLRCGVPLQPAVVATVVRKFFVVFSHGSFLALATLASWSTLERASQATIGRRGMPLLLLAASAALLVVAIGGAAATVHGRVADRLHGALDRAGGRWIGPWLERHAGRFHETDAALSSFFGERLSTLVVPIALYMAGWVVRSLETLLFLRLLGVDVPLVAAMVVETALILVRAMAVPVPAGIGVQDLGYILALRALGVPDATTVGAAFVVLKRGKDLFWILVGFGLAALGRRAERLTHGVERATQPSAAPHA